MTTIARFEAAFSGEPRSVGEVRHIVGDYLADGGFPHVGDVQLAITEAATNAILHSLSGTPGGKFRVCIEVVAGAWIQVDVCDQGAIPPGCPRSPFQEVVRVERGLGRPLIYAVAAECQGEHGEYTDLAGHHCVWVRLPFTTPAEHSASSLLRVPRSSEGSS